MRKTANAPYEFKTPESKKNQFRTLRLSKSADESVGFLLKIYQAYEDGAKSGHEWTRSDVMRDLISIGLSAALKRVGGLPDTLDGTIKAMADAKEAGRERLELSRAELP